MCDLVVIDEAHRLRNVYKNSSKIALSIKQAVASFPKVLFTATPLQNSLLELYGLVSIIDDYAFGDLESYRTRSARLSSEDNFAELKERLAPICKRTLHRQVLEYVKYTNRHALAQEFVPTPEEQRLYDLVSAYLQRDTLYALPASQRQLVTLILRSHDIAEEKRQELLRLFPEIRTEGGKIDFERLKHVLGEAVDVGKERYGMNWPGKADCFKTIQSPSLATLRPCPEEGINFDTTENLIIEGDNLEVLKLLQKSYLGKVYIDPPYNTGNDFIYPDNYTEPLQTYLAYTGQVDAEGRKFGTNTDSRFHSKWLNMMYPRLYLAKNLLREDGVIVVSADDNEFANLQSLCHELFGEENLIGTFVVNAAPNARDYGHFGKMHEYAVFYAKNIEVTKPF